jgi:hypothetical protein
MHERKLKRKEICLTNEQNNCYSSVLFGLRYERSYFPLNFKYVFLQVKLGVEVRVKAI